jgi:hypothetical protein
MIDTSQTENPRAYSFWAISSASGMDANRPATMDDMMGSLAIRRDLSIDAGAVSR